MINPSYTTECSWSLSYSEPLGLAYIAAAIEKDARHQVEILDCIGLEHDFPKSSNNNRVGLEEDIVFDLLRQKKFDVIGITLVKMFSDEKQIYNFIGKLKREYPEKPIICGGPDATLEWESYMKTGNIDFIVLGEGEGTIIELLEVLSGKGSLKNVLGLVFQDKEGSIIRNNLRDPLDINTIPWPARHLLPMRNYLHYRAKAYYRRNPAATILTSKGCPYKCLFCSAKIIWGNKWRGRSPIDIIDEMEYLIHIYGVREFLIQDDNFMVNPKRVEAICDEIMKRKLLISWQVVPGLAIWLLNKDLLLKLKDSGFYALCAQIETGNKKTKQYIKKNISFDHAREIMHYANKIGLWTQTNIIIGFYFETKEDILESIRTAESFHIDNINYVFARPYPHTEMYRDYLEQNIIGPDDTYIEPLETPHLTREELIVLRKKAQRNHYLIRFFQILNPIVFYQEFWPKINSLEKFIFFIKRIIYV